MESPVFNYDVYLNYVQKKAIGHKVSCRHYKKHGGAQLKTGKWIGPFRTRAVAEKLGGISGFPFHWCPKCS
jgi:hypothetical protein